MNPAHSPYADPNTVLSFADQPHDLDYWALKLSAIVAVANNYTDCDSDGPTLTKDGYVEISLHFQISNERGFDHAIEKIAAKCTTTRKADPR